MKKHSAIILYSILMCLAQGNDLDLKDLKNENDLQDSKEKNTISQNENKNDESNNKLKNLGQNKKWHVLNKITSTLEQNTETKTYQSGTSINTMQLNSTPSGNGDITSILRITPNVQYDNAQMRSSSPGEIDPANISISGGLFYQNNFQLDGVNMNNDLDPNGGTTNGPNALRSGRSQGMAIDSSLIESINVQDSNISAAYGGFTGGVIEANTKKPRKDKGGLFGWHGSISYQFTGSAFTQYFIDPDQYENFITSSNENYQPNFTKHIVRANLEGWVGENLGILASYSTTRSFIPLQAYSTATMMQNTNEKTREQHRYIDNYFIKANYNPTEKLTIEGSLAYMPQDNTYFQNTAQNSFYSMKSGGLQSVLKALFNSDLGQFSNNLSYSYMQNSRASERNYFVSVQNPNGANLNIGGYGDMNQTQNTINYKTDMQFNPIENDFMSNVFRVGAEANFIYAMHNRLNSYFAYGQNITSFNCNEDIINDPYACQLQVSTIANKNTTTLTQSLPGEVSLSNLAYGIYGEDNMTFDLGHGGMISVRPGIRIDGDTYMAKNTFAPRFSLNYTAPWSEYKTTAIFGANRYYGRNLLSYRLYDIIINNKNTFKYQNNTWSSSTSTAGSSDYEFNRLNVPYADEFVVGFTQNLGIFDMIAKYIYRAGRDEIMQKTADNNKTTWSNEGKSDSHILTLSIQNKKALDFYGTKNWALFAFDWTNVVRSYNLYNVDDAYVNNDDVIYNGQTIKYKDRPAENFVRPFTIRLSTTHTYYIHKTKLLWNNFFRYRGGYDAMVLLSKNDAGYVTSSSLKQYGKMHFDGAFTWDMRLGFEINIKQNILFVNLDIYNVLNTKNKTALSGTNGAITPGIASSSMVAVYEIGRQFWLQCGYRF